MRTFDPVFTLTNCRRWRSLARIRMFVRDLSIPACSCQPRSCLLGLALGIFNWRKEATENSDVNLSLLIWLLLG